jgi:RNA polymerase sigma-70 factor (ECF subfamily)
MREDRMNEKELVEGCIAGKKKCQELLYQRFAGAMMNVCLRYFRSEAEAEDALQEAFIKVFLNLHHFRFESSLGFWIKKVTINTLLTKLRKKGADDLSVNIHDYDENMLSVTMQEDPVVPMGVLIKMIHDLPHGYRTVFNMREIDGYELQQIADTLQCTNVTVRSQLFKAKTKLKQSIEKWIKEEYK